MIPHRAILFWVMNVYLEVMSVIRGLKYIGFGLNLRKHDKVVS